MFLLCFSVFLNFLSLSSINYSNSIFNMPHHLQKQLSMQKEHGVVEVREPSDLWLQRSDQWWPLYIEVSLEMWKYTPNLLRRLSKIIHSTIWVTWWYKQVINCAIKMEDRHKLNILCMSKVTGVVGHWQMRKDLVCRRHCWETIKAD